MKPINIEATNKTPEVNFDAESGLLELKGRSIPENTVEFYKPLQVWLNKYGQNPSPKTTVKIFIEYFNTSSSKCIYDLLKKLEEIHKAGNEILVNWYYEDDDEALLESGEELKMMIDLPFETISVSIDSM